MKEILLCRMCVDNFKGIAHEDLFFDGKSAVVMAANGVGKTSLMDAYTWALFGKDSRGRTDFDEIRHGEVEARVELAFTVDGVPVKLGKGISYRFERKKGDIDAVKKGTTATYFIDDVPQQKKDYDDFVLTTFANGEDRIFPAITDPDYLAGKASWQCAREILIDLFGGASEDDKMILQTESTVRPLLSRMGMVPTVSKYAEIASGKIRAINKQLAEIRPRIDEADRVVIGGEMPKATDGPRLVQIAMDMSGHQNRIRAIENGAALADAIRASKEAHDKLDAARREHEARFAFRENSPEALQVVADIAKLAQDISVEEYGLRSLRRTQEIVGAELQELRKKAAAIHAEEYCGDSECPVCHRPYDDDALARAKADFNVDKAQRIDRVTVSGKAKRSEYDEISEKVSTAEVRVSVLKAALESANEKSNAMTETSTVPFEDTEDYGRLSAFVDFADNEKTKITESAELEIEIHRRAIAKLTAEEQEIRGRMAYKDIAEKQMLRKEALLAEEKELAAELALYERDVVMAASFIAVKAERAEKLINSAFSRVKWSLYEPLVNGGVKDKCEATVDGVAYLRGLNSSAKTLAGLDVISAVSRAVGIAAPTFIDNAENCTEFPSEDRQTIRLYVSDVDDRRLSVTLCEPGSRVVLTPTVEKEV